MMQARCLPVLLALASTTLFLPAQDADAFRFAPADSLAVMRISAPAKWKQLFASTQVQKLVASDAMAPVVEAVSMGVQSLFEAMRSSGAFDAELVESLLDTYSGDMVVAVSIDLAKAMNGAKAEGADEEEKAIPPFSVAITLTPDGKSDLAKLAAAIQKSVEDEGGEKLSDMQVGDHHLRRLEVDGGAITVPTMIGDHMVFMVSTDMESYGAKVLGDGAHFSAPATAQEASMFWHIEIDPIRQGLIDVLKAKSKRPVDAAAVFDAFGFGCLDSLEGSIGAKDKHVASEFVVHLNAAPRGLVGLQPKASGAPKLLRYVPANAEAFSVGGFDLSAIYNAFRDVMAQFGDTAPMTWDQIEAQFAETMKVRLKEDIVDHLGTEWLTLQDPHALEALDPDQAAEANPLALAFDGACFGIALKDGKAFGEALETMLRSRGLHAARKSEDYAGKKVYLLRIAAVFEVEYAVTDDLLLIALGKSPAGKQSLRAVLDMCASPAAAGELPASVKGAAASFPAGWSGIAATSMRGFVRGFIDAMRIGVAQAEDGEVPAEIDAVMNAMSEIGSALGRFGLETMVTITTVSDKSIRFSGLW